MYIKSIILDGFKSYGQRTEVHGFDRQFNAITGLNGSGKSNLLDSICFVLGITNTSLVRANCLQDLIFKSGQAGINKATVTLVFDNSNTDQSPPGLEGCKEITVTRQVAMGGKNKYMLNGSTVTQGKIQDMFCSVQLNVNNPHFLIMQGRVTKVLNMRPMEILSMIEEAAGTRMYENKKQNALKSIEKKDAKLQEIRGILTEEITPKLEQLKAERAAFLAYERLERELQYWMGLYEACKYRQIQKQLVASKNAFENGQEKVACFKDSIKANKAIIIELDNEIKELSERAETSNSNNLKQLEAELKQCELANVKAISVVKATKENIATEENKKKQLLKNLKEDENALTAKESELSKVESVFKKLKENEAVDKEAYTASQQKFEALNVGMEVNDEGKAETLQEQLMNAKSEGAQAATIIKQATMKLSHFQSEITAKERELGSNSEEFSKDNQMLKKIESEIQSLENNLKKMNYSEERMQELQIKRRELMKEHTTVQENVENFAARRPYSQFNYTNPIPNFDKRRVFGVVCRLITLKDKKAATALQEVAGGRLYNVVIDTQETGNLLLKKGNLQQRVTFIPMNKIRSGKISDNTVKFAQSLVGTENVCSALSLITYDNKLQAAMEFVFGNTLVCKDLNVARQVAFHPNIKKRCVTLDGDVVDPAGILTGGARDKSASVLLQLEAIKGYEGRLVEIQEELKRVETEMMQMNKVQENWRGINNQLEMKRHDLRLIEQRLKQTSHHQLQEEINGLKATIEQLTEEISVAKETEAKCIKKAKDLELKIGDSKGYKEKQLKEAESEMNRLKVKAEKSQQEWKKREQEYETLVLEISELKKEIENIKEQITACEEELKHLTEQLQSQTVEAERTKGIVDEQQKALKAEKAAVAEKNKEVQKKIQRKENLAQEISNHELEMKKLEHEMKTLETDYRNCVAKEKEYADRCSEKNLKEVENYSDKEAADLEKRIRAAQETQKKQSKTVNLKAKAMYEKEEKQYASLTKKIRIIENDKKHILRVVDNLEKRKKEAIILAYEQITRDFGSIFGTLLPGANAKLQPLQNKSPLEGLEIKVSLGGVWKNSLNELSGGQRSLVALSLILAMLLFKPAPLYILDEVDAALDLSHTQNIGNMLRAHFKQSQFILVSLKEGMYGNANVLFHTKFTDGLSHVTRTVHNLSK